MAFGLENKHNFHVEHFLSLAVWPRNVLSAKTKLTDQELNFNG